MDYTLFVDRLNIGLLNRTCIATRKPANQWVTGLSRAARGAVRTAVGGGSRRSGGRRRRLGPRVCACRCMHRSVHWTSSQARAQCPRYNFSFNVFVVRANNLFIFFFRTVLAIGHWTRFSRVKQNKNRRDDRDLERYSVFARVRARFSLQRWLCNFERWVKRGYVIQSHIRESPELQRSFALCRAISRWVTSFFEFDDSPLNGISRAGASTIKVSRSRWFLRSPRWTMHSVLTAGRFFAIFLRDLRDWSAVFLLPYFFFLSSSKCAVAPSSFRTSGFVDCTIEFISVKLIRALCLVGVAETLLCHAYSWLRRWYRVTTILWRVDEVSVRFTRSSLAYRANLFVVWKLLRKKRNLETAGCIADIVLRFSAAHCQSFYFIDSLVALRYSLVCPAWRIRSQNDFGEKNLKICIDSKQLHIIRQSLCGPSGRSQYFYQFAKCPVCI